MPFRSQAHAFSLYTSIPSIVPIMLDCEKTFIMYGTVSWSVVDPLLCGQLYSKVRNSLQYLTRERSLSPSLRRKITTEGPHKTSDEIWWQRCGSTFAHGKSYCLNMKFLMLWQNEYIWHKLKNKWNFKHDPPPVYRQWYGGYTDCWIIVFITWMYSLAMEQSTSPQGVTFWLFPSRISFVPLFHFSMLKSGTIAHRIRMIFRGIYEYHL